MRTLFALVVLGSLLTVAVPAPEAEADCAIYACATASWSQTNDPGVWNAAGNHRGTLAFNDCEPDCSLYTGFGKLTVTGVGDFLEDTCTFNPSDDCNTHINRVKILDNQCAVAEATTEAIDVAVDDAEAGGGC